MDASATDAIEEARAVEEMVTECGSAAKAAERFRRHESWVSQRRALLKLTPPLQNSVRSGELPVRIARSIAALPADEQEAAWHATLPTVGAPAEAAARLRRSGPARRHLSTSSRTLPSVPPRSASAILRGRG
jgi:ParB family chromosome partitioning protein